MTPRQKEIWMRRLRTAVLVAIPLVLFAASIEDWRRDFVANEAEVRVDGDPTRLAPLVTRRPAWQVAEAAKWGAKRIGGFEWIGQGAGGDTIEMQFVRRGRILPFEEDVTVTIRDAGGVRTVTAVSRSRSSLPDLGRNPRNLRRLFEEMRNVLRGAAPAPVPPRRLS
jgi:hypothetical protein